MRRMAAIAALGALVLAGCSTAPDGGSRGSGVLAEGQVAPLLEGVPERSISAPPAVRLADDLVPPTNTWFSGLVFNEQPLPVFPQPLSFGLTGTGFEFGVPTVTTAPGAITGGFTPHVGVDARTDSQLLTAYDGVSVTVTGLTDGQPTGRVTITRGSPVVGYHAEVDHDLALRAFAEPLGDGTWLSDFGGQRYALAAPDGEVSEDGLTLSLPANASATWVAVPTGADAAELASLATPITGVSTSYSGTTTTLDYATATDEPALVGVLPHQAAGLERPGDCSLGTFTTVYGELALCSTSSLRWSVEPVEPAASLDLSTLDAPELEELAAQVREDVASTPAIPADTYFGGKALARLATLLQLARDLELDDVAAEATDTLATELRLWMEPDGCAQRDERCFVYDPELRGMVGLPAAFGSDEFNDHHFHYGYFLFAAGVLAADDRALADELAPVMTLLAADIASGGSSPQFPNRRPFDAYSGHSWASGFSPFADGNNQESSSEAVAAWNGLALWAQAVDDDPLEQEARWMLAAEAESAMRYWLDFDAAAAPYAGFDRSVVGIVWDGKRDYGTWFSAEPSAILGIQLLPMQPVAGYLAADPARILGAVDEASPGGEPGQFADYLLMYRALAGPDAAAAALDEARSLPADRIDDGNSRSYLLAWILSHT